jgi:hypothetical protein
MWQKSPPQRSVLVEIWDHQFASDTVRGEVNRQGEQLQVLIDIDIYQGLGYIHIYIYMYIYIYISLIFLILTHHGLKTSWSWTSELSISTKWLTVPCRLILVQFIWGWFCSSCIKQYTQDRSSSNFLQCILPTCSGFP